MSAQWERWPRTENGVELECGCECGQAADCKGTAGATLEGSKGGVATTLGASAKASEASTTEARMDDGIVDYGQDERQQQDADERTAHDAVSGYLARAFKACPPTVLEAASIAWVCGVETAR